MRLRTADRRPTYPAHRAAFASLAALGMTAAALAADPQLPGDPQRGAALYASSNCQGCHGRGGIGETSPTLLGPWKYGGDPVSMARSIREGFTPLMLPMGGKQLSDPEINDIVAYLIDTASKLTPEQRARAALNRPQGPPAGIVHSAVEDFRVEWLANFAAPYSMDFLPDGTLLVSETGGTLRMFAHGKVLPEPVAGAPSGDITGMTQWFRRANLSLAVHPDYRRNGWVYLLTARKAQRPGAEGLPLTVTVHRGKLRDGKWVDGENILDIPTESTDSLRIKFDAAGMLYVGTPYGSKDYSGAGENEPSQDLSRPDGKILRIRDDGSVPPDNPFAARAGAYPYTWSYGHREPSGLTFDGAGELWSVEDGPRGGDELNHIRKGRNYGWPVITWGHRYDNQPVAANPTRDGMEQPVVSWAPSPAVSDVEWYGGNAFPRWRGSFFVGSFKQRDLFRVTVDGDRMTLVETVMHNVDRIRDIAAGPDGLIYVLTDGGDLLRLVPARSGSRR